MAASRWRTTRNLKLQPKPLLNRIGILLANILLMAACTVPVTIEWTTEVEMDTAGFDIYRGEAPDGPYAVKVNDELIPAAPDPMAGGEYSIVDRTARAGRTYYYQLQELEAGGAVNTYGPIEVRAGWVDAQWFAVVAGIGLLVMAAWLRQTRLQRREQID